MKNVGLEQADILGKAAVGALIGDNLGSVYSSYATGTVTGSDYYIGGLIGSMRGTLQHSYAAVTVKGEGTLAKHVGGLIGAGEIAHSLSMKYVYANGAVSGQDFVGGLAGSIYTDPAEIPIEYLYAGGEVSGYEYVGGLIGWHRGGRVQYAYASGKVTSTLQGIPPGGLAGALGDGATAFITLSILEKMHWNTTVGPDSSIGIDNGYSQQNFLKGITENQMTQKSSYTHFDDFENHWNLIEGVGTPYFEYPATLALDESVSSDVYLSDSCAAGRCRRKSGCGSSPVRSDPIWKLAVRTNL